MAIDSSEGNKELYHFLFPSILGLGATLSYKFTSDDAFFDALRSVNSNFEGMSDYDIWWHSLSLEPEQLMGLTSLAKGAYFEHLVAEETGGVLHEHFNHPDTDITIDGIEYQIKATDSVSYVNSVDKDIPVITTTEISDITGSQDIGVSNEELNSITDNALGMDANDTLDGAIDLALGSIGGIGVFASIKGVGHYQKLVNEGVNKLDASEVATIVAIEGTAKGAVDLMEFIYKVIYFLFYPFIWMVKKCVFK